MKALRWVVILACIVILAGAGVLFWLQQNVVNTSTPWADLSQPRHPVSKDMLDATAKRKGKPAPEFELVSTDGTTVKLSVLAKKTPVVIVATKEGCPCSIESQPFFNDIARAYGDKVQFLGIFDADKSKAAKYRADFKVPYPLLVAGSSSVYKDYESPRSVYVTLVSKDMEILKMWPGYSKTMLGELNQQIATAAGTDKQNLDFGIAPEKMNSGCQFE